MMPQQTKWPFLAGLEDCSECKLYHFIYAYYFVTIVIMWLILRQKMSCFSHQSFLGGGVRGGGSWGSSTVVDYAMRGAREKNTPNNGGGPKNAGEQI